MPIDGAGRDKTRVNIDQGVHTGERNSDENKKRNDKNDQPNPEKPKRKPRTIQQPNQLLILHARSHFHSNRVPNTPKVLNMRMGKLTSPITDPQEMSAGVVKVLGGGSGSTISTRRVRTRRVGGGGSLGGGLGGEERRFTLARRGRNGE